MALPLAAVEAAPAGQAADCLPAETAVHRLSKDRNIASFKLDDESGR